MNNPIRKIVVLCLLAIILSLAAVSTAGAAADPKYSHESWDMFADEYITDYFPTLYTPKGQTPRTYWGQFKDNCFMFARLVVTSLDEEARDFTSNSQNGQREIAGIDDLMRAQYLNDADPKNPRMPTSADIKNVFNDAVVGDVVQMYWGYRDSKGNAQTTRHAAVISDIDIDGGTVEFLEANNPFGTIGNHSYTFQRLSELLAIPGKSGGITIYEYGKGIVDITPENFPDQTFRQYVLDHFDKDGDGKLDNAEIEAVTEIGIGTHNMTSVKGIEKFTSLKTFYYRLSYSRLPDIAPLSELDLSRNLQLESVYIESSRITELDLSNHKKLKGLSCYYNNKLGKLNVKGCTALENLTCYIDYDKDPNQPQYSYLKELDVSDCINLLKLDCQGHYLTSLDLSHNVSLDTLNCSHNSITELNLDNCTKLTSLKCHKNKLENLNVSRLTKLSILRCEYNNFRELDLSNNLILTLLTCQGNHITTLDLSKQTRALNYFWDGYWWHPGLWQTVAVSESKVSSNRYNMTDVVPSDKLANIVSASVKGYDSADKEITTTYTESTGVVQFASYPAKVCYNYNTGCNYEYNYYKYNYDNTKYNYLNVTVYFADAPQITTNALDTAPIGKYHTQTMKASGTQPITWSATGLPANFTIDSKTGVIRGTGQEKYAGEYNVTITATNNGGSDTVTLPFIVGDTYTFKPPTITTESLPSAKVKAAGYSVQLSATGATPITWELLTKYAVSGIQLTSSGILSCLPTKAGTFSIEVKAVNAYGSAQKTLTLNVIESKPVITTSKLTTAYYGENYSYTLEAADSGVQDNEASPADNGGIIESLFKWAKAGGSLPSGIKIDKTGELKGTPKKAGTFSFTAKVTDNNKQYTTKTLTLEVLRRPEITTKSLKSGASDKSYSLKLKGTGTAPLAWDVKGLPEGFTFNKDTGEISGQTSGGGTFLVVITLSNAVDTAQKTLPLQITPKAPKISVKSLTDGRAGQPYTYSLAATGTKPITWTAENLPAGLTLDGSTGIITGTPSHVSNGKITFTASNIAGKKTKKIALKVDGIAPSITTEALPDGTTGTGYSASVNYAGDPDITLKVSGLPKGLTFNNGTIAGTPTKAGTYNVTVKAKSVLSTASKKLTLNIKAADSSARVVKTSYSYADTEDTQPYSAVSDNPVPSYTGYEYVTVYEFPEMSADVSGMYDFGVVLSDDVPEGADLVWLAGSDTPSEDDDIAEFYNYDGEEIESVPENRSVTVSAWLNKGTIYRPSIAIRR